MGELCRQIRVRSNERWGQSQGYAWWMIGGKAIKVDELAAGMSDVALKGSEVKTLDNVAMVARGRAALKG